MDFADSMMQDGPMGRLVSGPNHNPYRTVLIKDFHLFRSLQIWNFVSAVFFRDLISLFSFKLEKILE